MDWSKIKTVLIVALVITNLLLGGIIINEKATYTKEREENLENVIALLKSKSIGISQMTFDFPKTIDSIEVEYETYDDDVVESLLGADYRYEDGVYFNNKAQVTLSNTKLSYETDEASQMPLDFDLEKQAIQTQTLSDNYKEMIENLMTSWGFDQAYTISSGEQYGDYVSIDLNEYYKSYQLEDAKMTLIINTQSQEVVKFNRTWIRILDNNMTSKYDIIAVDKALFSVLPSLNQGDEIDAIQLIYKLNDSNLIVSNLISGEALPYYLITTETGEHYYVEAMSEQ